MMCLCTEGSQVLGCGVQSLQGLQSRPSVKMTDRVLVGVQAR